MEEGKATISKSKDEGSFGCDSQYNFINVKRTNFSYKRSFWQLFLVTCT